MIIQYIIVGMIILCSFIAVINYYSSAPMIIKLLSLPFAILLSIYTIYFVYDKLGSPIEGMPEGQFEYVHHKVSNGGEEILLWAEIEDRDRLYIFDYNRENMKKLNEAQESKGQGQGNNDVLMEMSKGIFRIIEDDEIITDEIGSDARIKQETQENQTPPGLAGGF